MLFKLHDGKEYRVTWKYRYNPASKKNETICEILPASAPKGAAPLFTGTAICSPKDNFSKNKGRKISLNDALGMPRYSDDLSTFLGYEWYDLFKMNMDRTAVWQAYNKMRNGRW